MATVRCSRVSVARYLAHPAGPELRVNAVRAQQRPESHVRRQRPKIGRHVRHVSVEQTGRVHVAQQRLDLQPQLTVVAAQHGQRLLAILRPRGGNRGIDATDFAPPFAFPRRGTDACRPWTIHTFRE